MKVVMWLGIAYCVYGLLYLLGIPHVAPKYRNRTWTRRYQRSCGIGWLMIGIPWLALYVLSVNCQVAHPLLATLIVVLALPSIFYGFLSEKRFRKIADNENAE